MARLLGSTRFKAHTKYYKTLLVILNAYALHSNYKPFYKHLWGLNLPSKIKITLWRISWNFILTLVNMQVRKLVSNVACPRCCNDVESLDHVFRTCPISIEVWSELGLSIVLIKPELEFRDWLTWIFSICSN